MQRDGGEPAADETGAMGACLFGGEGAKSGHALFNAVRRDGRGGMQRPCPRAWPRRKRKQMQIAEGQAANEGERLFELAIGFAGKAHHHVCAQREIGAGGAQQATQPFPRSARGGSGDASGAARRRSPIAAADARGGQARPPPNSCHQRDQFVVPIHGLDGAEPQAGQSGLLDDRAHQRGEGGGRAGLRMEIAAPAAEIDAREHEFLAASGDESLNLAHDYCVGQTVGRPSREGNHAKRAAVAAALLDLQVGPRLRARRELRVFEEGVSEAIVDPDWGVDTRLCGPQQEQRAQRSRTRSDSTGTRWAAAALFVLRRARDAKMISGASALWLLPTTAATPRHAANSSGARCA